MCSRQTQLLVSGSADITFGDPSTGFSEFERLNLLLGSGNDVLSISGSLVAADGRPTLTVVHGGGNTVQPDAGDTIIVVGGGGPISQLVLLGDTTQDGSWYQGGTTGLDIGPKPFTDPTGGDPDDNRFIVPVGVPFANDGNDRIDAAVLFGSSAPGQPARPRRRRLRRT